MFLWSRNQWGCDGEIKSFQEFVVDECMEPILSDSVVTGMRSVLELIYMNPITHTGPFYKDVQPGTLMVLSCGHMSVAIHRLLSNPTTVAHPLVQGANEKGFRNAVVWKPDTPRYICQFICDRSNKWHKKGASDSFAEVLKNTHREIEE